MLVKPSDGGGRERGVGGVRTTLIPSVSVGWQWCRIQDKPSHPEHSGALPYTLGPVSQACRKDWSPFGS